MFMNDVNKKEEIRKIAVADLKNFGIKFRPKKSRQHLQVNKSNKIFKRPLECLPMETVTLPSGRQVIVPKIVHQLCSFIISKVDTEGLFRKGGSKSRQTEIKLSLDAGCHLGTEHHEVDVANILKTLFRDLPEPLIPFPFHELFMRCVLLNKNQEATILLSCLLLPIVHLNTLSYFMQFLQRVSEYSQFNKMDAYNLAVVIGPTLMPAEEKLTNDATFRMTKTCDIFKLLILNASSIGLISNNIIDRIAQVPISKNDKVETLSAKKKKKRRSGSLTRMLSGLKKIVTHKTDEAIQAAPDLITTPSLMASAKRRKIDGLSSRKKEEIVNNLPHGVLLNVPYTPKRTPAKYSHKKAEEDADSLGKNEVATKKRVLWSDKIKSVKKKYKETTSSTSSIQRRWSAVSTATGLKNKNRRKSCTELDSKRTTANIMNDENVPPLDDKNLVENRVENARNENEEPNYMRISKTEYEEIKNRVSAIERRLSEELEREPPERDTSPETVDIVRRSSIIDEVEKKYEETLERNEQMSPTTNQLVKRFSRELKIRKSGDEKLFRSPSARKIGSIRRKENQKQRLARTQTWCVTTSDDFVIPTRKTFEQLKAVRTKNSLQNSSNEKSSTSNASSGSCSSWKSAEGFFSNTPENDPALLQAQMDNCRASIARIRCQNAGMVMEKARLFDNLVDNENEPVTGGKTRVAKMGANRAAPQINRIKTLRSDDKRKKSMSPRKRPCRSPGIHRLNRLNNLKISENDEDIERNLKGTPKIKQSLCTKSPRKLYRSSALEACKRNPLKVPAPSINC